MPNFGTKLLPITLASGLLIALCGCGGGGSQIALNSYPGTWSGTATTTTSAGIPVASAQMTLVIDTSDNITGTDGISLSGVTTTDTGTISSNGAFTLTSTRSGSSVVAATFTGTLSVINDTLQGAGTIVQGGTSTPITFSLPYSSSATSIVAK